MIRFGLCICLSALASCLASTLAMGQQVGVAPTCLVDKRMKCNDILNTLITHFNLNENNYNLVCSCSGNTCTNANTQAIVPHDLEIDWVEVLKEGPGTTGGKKSFEDVANSNGACGRKITCVDPCGQTVNGKPFCNQRSPSNWEIKERRISGQPCTTDGTAAPGNPSGPGGPGGP